MKRMSAAGRSQIALIRFPGSNCDADCVDVFRRHFGVELKSVWHTESALPPVDAVILPGGFSYGDYLRSGALAAHAPVMAAVREFAGRGGALVGICNGFQILTESHLLPGALLRNIGQRFVCSIVSLGVAPGRSTYQSFQATGVNKGSRTDEPSGAPRTLRMPIAHGEGRFYIDDEGLARLRGEGQIVYRYVSDNGAATATANPNGSIDGIAGIVSKNGRVLGLMPHPERASDAILGSTDGLEVLKGFLASFT